MRRTQSKEYFRQRRADLIARKLCLDCRKPTPAGRRCKRCAEKHTARVNGYYQRKPVIVPAPKEADKVARMLKLAEFLIPPSRVGIEDIHRRKESA